MPDDIFAPLPSDGQGTAGAGPRENWRPIVPVPADAPPVSPRHPRHGAPSQSWTYRGAAGELLGYLCRFDPAGGKEFAPLTYCENAATGARAWRWKAWPVPRPLYGLDRLAARPTAPVVICEGEKAADAATELLPDHVAVTSPNGAGSAHKAYWGALASRDVTLWPDNDPDGRAYAEAVARALCGIAATISMVSTPAGAGEKWDAADALAEGWDGAKTAALIAEAVPASGAEAAPQNPANDDAEIARLAALPPLQYEREREAAAKGLGINRVSILDRLVTAARGNGAAGGQGRPLDLRVPEPWPSAVGGSTLLDALAAAVRRHVVLGAAEADSAALWALATHAFDAFPVFPRLFVTAPEKGCGKSTLLDVLFRTVPRPLSASSITAAALFRTIEAARPSLLLDEADTYARDNEDLRGVLNDGHRRDGFVIRTVGDDHEPRRFSTWAPIALAAIGHLPGTVEDRSIKIVLRRRRADEAVEPLRLDRTGDLEKLARMAARWTADHAAVLAAADPPMPVGIVNRAADNWRPLLAIADLAGGTWPERARRAAVELTADGDDSIKIALLADIRAAFAVKAADRLSSDELAGYLGGLDDRPWPEYRAGKLITKAQIARLLKGFHVSSGTIRLPDGSTPKGYYLAAFKDPFARYLPVENATPPQGQDFRGFRANFETPQVNGRGASKSADLASVAAGCGVVAAGNPDSDADDFAERAAIREYDAGYPRADAERSARAELDAARRPVH